MGCEWRGDAVNWRPIETAPKDGTPILAIDMTAKEPEPLIVQFGVRYSDAEDPWEIYVGDSDGDRGDIGWLPYATHWMPLPEPPTEVE